MQPFPAEHELLSLFESEPEVLDPGVPWAYNKLRFRTVRADDEIDREIEPGYEELRLRWSRAGKEVVRLDLRWVSGLAVEVADGSEALVAKFRDHHLRPLRLELRPAVHLAWGTSLELPTSRPAG